MYRVDERRVAVAGGEIGVRGIERRADVLHERERRHGTGGVPDRRLELGVPIPLPSWRNSPNSLSDERALPLQRIPTATGDSAKANLVYHGICLTHINLFRFIIIVTSPMNLEPIYFVCIISSRTIGLCARTSDRLIVLGVVILIGSPIV